MGHSYHNVLIHIVFSTKERRKLIAREHQENLWRYITGIAKNLDTNVLSIGGMPDHIHILLAQPGMMPFSTIIQKIKINSSKWMEDTVRNFEWQEGFGAFSVSNSRRKAVIDYIHNQEKHHKKRSFEDEFIALLKAHNIDYDPKYVFG